MTSTTIWWCLLADTGIKGSHTKSGLIPLDFIMILEVRPVKTNWSLPPLDFWDVLGLMIFTPPLSWRYSGHCIASIVIHNWYINNESTKYYCRISLDEVVGVEHHGGVVWWMSGLLVASRPFFKIKRRIWKSFSGLYTWFTLLNQ